eukprot:gene27553-56581_t
MLHRAVALSSAAVACSALSEEYVRGNGPLLWANFKQEHKKSYGAGEEALRYDIFMANMATAARLEKVFDPKATFGATPFADLAAE